MRRPASNVTSGRQWLLPLPSAQRCARLLLLLLSTFLAASAIRFTGVHPRLKSRADLNFPGGFHSKQMRWFAEHCSENKKHVGRILYFDNTRFFINEPDMCAGKIHLLVVVHTNAPYHYRRAAIRRTWGSVRQVGSRRIKTLFLLGNPGSTQLQKAIEEESRAYRDIAQRDFQESYRNMTRKHLTAMEWINDFCPHARYIMKVDDDTFVDIFHAMRLLQHNPPHSFYCTRTVGAKPARKRRGHLSKWRVTQAEFSGTRYPPYCEGLGYLMDGAVAKKLHWCSIFSKFFWIDDVYVTGILVERLGLGMEKFWQGHSYANMIPSHASEKIVDNLFLMASHNEFMPELWTKLWRAVILYSMDTYS